MDIIRKAMLMGLGLISLTREKAEAFADELIRRGELAREEKFKMVDNLLKEAQQQKEELTVKIKENVQKIISEMGLVTKKEFEEILKKQDEIEKKIEKLVKRIVSV